MTTVRCVMCGGTTLAVEASMSAHGLMCSTCHTAETNADDKQMNAQARAAAGALGDVVGGAALGAVGIDVLSSRGLGEAAPLPARMPVVRPATSEPPGFYAKDHVVRVLGDKLVVLDTGAAQEHEYPLASIVAVSREGRADLGVELGSERVAIDGVASPDALLEHLLEKAPHLERWQAPVRAAEALTIPLVGSGTLLALAVLQLLADGGVYAGVLAVAFIASLGWVAWRFVRRPTRLALRSRLHARGGS